MNYEMAFVFFPDLLFCAVNKQLNDKERVAAALENPNLVDMVDECLAPTYAWNIST